MNLLIGRKIDEVYRARWTPGEWREIIRVWYDIQSELYEMISSCTPGCLIQPPRPIPPFDDDTYNYETFTHISEKSKAINEEHSRRVNLFYSIFGNVPPPETVQSWNSVLPRRKHHIGSVIKTSRYVKELLFTSKYKDDGWQPNYSGPFFLLDFADDLTRGDELILFAFSNPSRSEMGSIPKLVKRINQFQAGSGDPIKAPLHPGHTNQQQITQPHPPNNGRTANAANGRAPKAFLLPTPNQNAHCNPHSNSHPHSHPHSNSHSNSHSHSYNSTASSTKNSPQVSPNLSYTAPPPAKQKCSKRVLKIPEADFPVLQKQALEPHEIYPQCQKYSHSCAYSAGQPRKQVCDNGSMSLILFGLLGILIFFLPTLTASPPPQAPFHTSPASPHNN